MRDMTQELLQLYAARKAVEGHAFNADSHWQAEFEDLFEHEETPDDPIAFRKLIDLLCRRERDDDELNIQSE